MCSKQTAVEVVVEVSSVFLKSFPLWRMHFMDQQLSAGRFWYLDGDVPSSELNCSFIFLAPHLHHEVVFKIRLSFTLQHSQSDKKRKKR